MIKWITGAAIVLATWTLFSCTSNQEQRQMAQHVEAKAEEGEDKFVPHEHFFLQRTYPDATFPLKAYTQAIDEAHTDYLAKKTYPGSRSGSLSWTVEGPGNIGGRFNTIAVHPVDENIIYAGAAAGGVFKTTDGGQTWNPIFDDQPYLAIGDIELDPDDPDVVYVGTGDPNISGYPFLGDGVYKSTDGGQSWTHMGLTAGRIISRVEVHPLNSNLVYAGAIGLPFEKTNDRGLYKSTDGGQSWQQVLFLSDSAGVIDLLLHPTDTNVVYASGWNRIRSNTKNLGWGPESQIYKSTNGGQTWNPVMNGITGSGDFSRINLAMSGTNPNKVYASVVASNSYQLQDIYISSNGGNNWSGITNSSLDPEALGGFGWYFGKITVNPADDDEIYLQGVELHKTDNLGNFWQQATPDWWTYQVHADMHDLVFAHGKLYLATDGGLYKSTDNSATWQDIENIPVSQFYHVAVNPHNTGTYYGGMQDNGTAGGNAGNINNWPRIFGGDGFTVRFHPTNADIFYAETQNGGIVYTDDGGFNFNDATWGIDEDDRRNWDMPYILSYNNPGTLYTGTYRMYRSTAGANPSWQAVSGDLTDGVVYFDRAHTISTIDDAPTNSNYMYAGTSDGNVWRSADGGDNWSNITGTLPNRYVTDIECSYTNTPVVVVSHSGYKDNDFIPHIHYSNDLGNTWVDISVDLPQLAINNIEMSPLSDSLIFAATDGGVYYTLNLGQQWHRLGDNMPAIAVYDIEYDPANQKLIAGTFARSLMSIPVDSLNDLTVAPPPLLFAVLSNDTTLCAGDSTTLSVTANNDATFSWSPAQSLSCTECPNPVAEPAATTTYMVQVTDTAGQSLTDSVTVTVVPELQPTTIAAVNDTLYTGNTGNSGATYQWYINGTLIPGATDSFYVATLAGDYTVEISNGACAISAPAYNYQPPVGLQPTTTFTWQLYPNPAGKVVYIEAELETATRLSITDIKGSTVHQQLLQPQQGTPVKVDVQQLPKGLYLVTLTTPETTVLKKLMID